jgi:signal transduction histidine kinase
MLYYFISLLTAAMVLLFVDIRNETNRWAAFFLTSASIGGLPGILDKQGWEAAASWVAFVNLTLTPYGVLVFSLLYSGNITLAAVRSLLKIGLLIPIIVMAGLTAFGPPLNMDFRLLLLWTGPYYLTACWLLIVSLWKEQDSVKKRSRFVVTAIIVPTLLAVLVLIHVGQVISPGFDYFRYVSLFIVYSLVTALIGTFLYGVLGVRLRLEKDPLESSLTAAASGAVLLNHTIKNELGKITISTENLRGTLPVDSVAAEEHLRIIDNASEHMRNMVGRIHGQLREIMLRESPCRLDRLADEVADQHRALLNKHRIRLNCVYLNRPTVLCDGVHLREALGNLLRNSIEAAPDGGEIQLRIEAIKREIRLSVQDQGEGIPPERLSRIFEPFYSTKNGKMNFGLGLSYVYRVMRLSGGKVEVSSQVKEGTRVTLRFPPRKWLRGGEGETQ